jgi:hypothetical protein
MTPGRPSTGEGPTGHGSDYIRGAGGVAVDRRRIVMVIGAAVVVALLALAFVLAVEAAQRYQRIDRLRAEGVPVVVTVTDCLGLASGTGITEVGFSCHGTFRLGARHYHAGIDGTAQLYPVGASLDAVTVPGDPQILYTAAAASALHTPWTEFVAPAALFLGAVAVLAVGLRVLGRRSPPRAPTAVQL